MITRKASLLSLLLTALSAAQGQPVMDTSIVEVDMRKWTALALPLRDWVVAQTAQSVEYRAQRALYPFYLPSVTSPEFRVPETGVYRVRASYFGSRTFPSMTEFTWEITDGKRIVADLGSSHGSFFSYPASASRDVLLRTGTAYRLLCKVSRRAILQAGNIITFGGAEIYRAHRPYVRCNALTDRAGVPYLELGIAHLSWDRASHLFYWAAKAGNPGRLLPGFEGLYFLQGPIIVWTLAKPASYSSIIRDIRLISTLRQGYFQALELPSRVHPKWTLGTHTHCQRDVRR